MVGFSVKFKKVAVGGTFDYLHNGHVAILSKAFEVGERVTVGIASDHMNLRKDSVGISPLEERRKALIDFLRSKGWDKRAKVVVITDPFGPAIEDDELEAIVVSEETRPRAEEINRIRISRRLKPLEIIQIPWVLAEDETPISSIRIRYGEMDIHGKIRRGKKTIH